MERATRKTTIQAYLYLLPALLIIVLFTIYPIIKSLLISFYDDYDYFNDIVYARGIASYLYLWHDPTFHKALGNTFIFVIGVVPASIVLSMLIAILLNSNIRLRSFFRTAYFIPFVTSVVAVSIVWRWIFHTEYGLFNYVLGLFGVDPVAWLTDPKWAMPSLIILSIWKGLGYNIIIFLAGLQNINAQYDLAARMDGAGKARRFFHITLPLLSPTTFFVSIVSIIGSFKVFDEIYALFGGQPGPVSSALTVVYYIFEKFYGEWEFGIASAAAYCLFIIIFILTLIQLYIGKRKVTY
ncbi:carbohydrate ABC transporter permease [Sporosarcina sp. Te-1]|uniref:carbohydrate ABC transporter permease n=1 Tax=Sporosarcina sp. Te-1 TaxID=2818390 RepID=UPI001A9E3083|nr:sugar ABC transporter permease [Sporosarcina sp. Te-1]QTD41026.1 sugar ABC transporter permease [Sporosarcina sp. Te-1]